MEKQDLVEFLSGIFIPLDFKRKGMNWISDGEIIKIINLQKSQYDDSYYINYDYIIKKLPLNGLKTHINNRLSSSNKEEQAYITNLLDLNNPIEKNIRLIELENIIEKKIVTEIKFVDTEKRLIEILTQRPFLYTIPTFVLQYLGIKTTY